MLAVPVMLWYQSSRGEAEPENRVTCYMVDLSKDKLEKIAIDPDNPDRDPAVLEYVRVLKKDGFHTAALTWLKFGAERGTSAEIMREYAAALERTDPQAAAEWRARAARLDPKILPGEKP